MEAATELATSLKSTMFFRTVLNFQITETNMFVMFLCQMV